VNRAGSIREPPIKRYTIGEVCRAVDRSPRTIRYWEQAGTIPPAHRDGTTGRRWWTEAEVAELQLTVYGDDLDVLAER
jgi:DNA-binding transcriptional MerR regulator